MQLIVAMIAHLCRYTNYTVSSKNTILESDNCTYFFVVSLEDIIIHISFKVETRSVSVQHCHTEYNHEPTLCMHTFMSLIENYLVTLNIRSQCVLPDLIKLIDSFAFLLAMVIRISRLPGRQDR